MHHIDILHERDRASRSNTNDQRAARTSGDPEPNDNEEVGQVDAYRLQGSCDLSGITKRLLFCLQRLVKLSADACKPSPQPGS